MRAKEDKSSPFGYVIEADREEIRVMYDALMLLGETVKTFTSPLSGCMYADARNGERARMIKRMASAIVKAIYP